MIGKSEVLKTSSNVGFWPLADVAVVSANVRFQGKSGPGQGAARLQLSGFSGAMKKQKPHVNEALRISPRDNLAFWWMNWVGSAKLRLNEFADAATWFRRAIENNRNYSWPHFGLAGALVQLGDIEAARAAVQQALVLHPNINVRSLRAKMATINPVFDEKHERLLDSLLRAGMPVG